MDVVRAVISRLKTPIVARFHLALENLALRQQLDVLQRSGKRPKLRQRDRIFWVLLSAIWPNWHSALVIVKPETVLGWRRQGFRLWRCWKSRSRKPGRPPISDEIRNLIRRMSRENMTWGAPRIESELRLVGYAVAERTVAKYMVRTPTSPTQTWRTFLNNHAIGMMGIDVLKACNSTLHSFCRLAILPHLLRLTSLIRLAITGWNGGAPLSEAPSTVVFGGNDDGTKYSAPQRHGTTSDEERPPVLSSEPQCLLLRVNAIRLPERGPPGQNDGNITSVEWGMNRTKARAA
jgi:hypothetical protein